MVEWHAALGKIELTLIWEAPRRITKVHSHRLGAIRLPRALPMNLYNVSLGAIYAQNLGKKG